VVAVVTAFALAAGPASYSLASVGRSLNGNNVTAGPTSQNGMGGGGGFARFGPGGGAGTSSTLVNYLESHQGSAKYLVAVDGSQSSAPLIIQTGKAVVTIGGFSGNDPAPTVSQLAAMVKKGELKYVLLSTGNGGGPGGGNSAITAWVKAHGKVVSSVATSAGTLYLVSA
jgi:4-amino-4-deoxy-L-arabinose transferase-like glycosyltransferase